LVGCKRRHLACFAESDDLSSTFAHTSNESRRIDLGIRQKKEHIDLTRSGCADIVYRECEQWDCRALRRRGEQHRQAGMKQGAIVSRSS
jgi:hypothetical protein